jgi:hypothetical protein
LWIHRAFVLATSLVPLAGVLWFGWSASTLLVIFWGETLLAGTANLARIRLHRQLTRASGHFRLHLKDSSRKHSGTKKPTRETTFFAEYATILYVFTFAHGLFLGFFLLMLHRNWRGEGPSPWQIDVESLRNGILAVAGITVLELLYDLTSLGQQPFSWLKQRVQVALGRVVILHLVVIFGAFLMMRFETPMSFLAILVGLKALMDLGTSAGPVETPASPPRWLEAIAKKQGLDMKTEWTNILAEQKRQAEEDEKPFAAD